MTAWPWRTPAGSRCCIAPAAGPGVAYVDGFRRAIGPTPTSSCRWTPPVARPAPPAGDGGAAAGADLVIGSRYLHGISVVNWPLRRIVLSLFANWYVRTVTGLGVRDCTAGYRAWRRDALAALPLDGIRSEGYAFQVEMTFLAAVGGLRITESPIIFIERREGASKLSSGVLAESLLTPWRLVARHGRARATPAAGYNSHGA